MGHRIHLSLYIYIYCLKIPKNQNSRRHVLQGSEFIISHRTGRRLRDSAIVKKYTTRLNVDIPFEETIILVLYQQYPWQDGWHLKTHNFTNTVNRESDSNINLCRFRWIQSPGASARRFWQSRDVGSTVGGRGCWDWSVWEARFPLCGLRQGAGIVSIYGIGARGLYS